MLYVTCYIGQASQYLKRRIIQHTCNANWKQTKTELSGHQRDNKVLQNKQKL